MSSVILSRALFGSAMAFHIIFATLGVGLPLMIMLAEALYLSKKDHDYAIMAKRWTRGFGILLGVGIPSGTIVGVLIALLWPGFMAVVGQVIALPFQIEIFAFFLEALFMSIYVYAADRLSPRMRFFSIVLVTLGAAASAVLITDAHSWMNTPRGFRMTDGRITDVRPWAAVWNPSFVVTSLHVLLSAFMTGAFAIASIAAYQLLKKRRDLSPREAGYHRKSLMIAILLGGTMSILTVVNGHATAQMLHRYIPEKLAAAEGLFHTTGNAPLHIFGHVNAQKQEIEGGLEIPGLLSFLATDQLSGIVRGLDDFPRNDWPPLFIHTLFNIMVGIGFILLFASLFALVFQLLMKKPYPRFLLFVFILSGPLCIVGIETGWIFSCTGRQPWTIYHIQRTADAATKAGNVGLLFVLFIGLYLLLLAITAVILNRYFKRHTLRQEFLGKGEGNDYV